MPKRITKKAAGVITTDMDRIATLLQNDYEALEIPQDVAFDAAKRLDLISDHIEKVAEHFDAETIGEEKKGPLHVEDKSDDMPGDFTQEEFSSVEDEARNRQVPLPKMAQGGKGAALPISNIHDLETQMSVTESDDDLPGEFTQEEFSAVREVAEASEPLCPGPGRGMGPGQGPGGGMGPNKGRGPGQRRLRSSGKSISRDKLRRRARTRRQARGVKLWAAVYGDGSLYGVDESRSASDVSYWPALRDEPEYAIYLLKNVPEDLAEDLKTVGFREQVFRDGNEAWDAASRYVEDIYDYDMDQWDEADIARMHGIRL